MKILQGKGRKNGTVPNNPIKDFKWWPFGIMLVCFMFCIMFLYCETYYFLFFLLMLVFSAFCLVRALYLLILKKQLKASLSFISPILLLLYILSPWSLFIRNNLTYLRHYIEFQIQKNIFIPEMNDVRNLPDYKEWPLKKGAGMPMKWIVYDAKDEVLKKDNTRNRYAPDCGYIVSKLEGHFYMLIEYCN